MPEDENNIRGGQYEKGNWVYYKSLKTTTYYPTLAKRVTEDFEDTTLKLSNIDRIAKIFLTMSKNELRHEKKLLKD